MNNNRIGIFIYGYGLGNAPSLINTGNALAGSGFAVDYFTCRTFIGDVEFDHPEINLYQIEDNQINPQKSLKASFGNLFPSSIRKWLGQNYYRLIEHKKLFLDKIFNEKRFNECEKSYLRDIELYVSGAEDIIGDRSYKCFIGAEPGGLMAAVMIGEKLGIPIVYYNLELSLSSEINTIRERVAKKFEKLYNQSVVFTITLDEERAALLAEDNGIDIKDILLVPVCAEGPIFDNKTNWLREKFNIPENVKIVLYAGFISEWAMSEDLAKAALSWPENRVLILHSHGYHNPSDIEKVKRYEGEKVKISLEPVPYDDLAAFLSSADIGVALYKDLGKNFTLVSSASGKLAHYLKSGLPVITNDYPSMKRVVESYNCGQCVHNPQEIVFALEKIFDDYEQIRSNAFVCYEENYMFSKQFAKVIKKIESLEN